MHRCKVHIDMLSSRSSGKRDGGSRWLDKRRGAVETARRLKLRTTEVGRKLDEVGSFRAWLTARSCIRASVNFTNTWPRIPPLPGNSRTAHFPRVDHVCPSTSRLIHFNSLFGSYFYAFERSYPPIKKCLLKLSDIFSSFENQFFQCF